jgi:hypothetical protein
MSYQCRTPVWASAWAMWRGRIRKHSISDAASTAITVKGMSWIISPIRPPMIVSP